MDELSIGESKAAELYSQGLKYKSSMYPFIFYLIISHFPDVYFLLEGFYVNVCVCVSVCVYMCEGTMWLKDKFIYE